MLKLPHKKLFGPLSVVQLLILKIYFFCRKLRHTASLLKLTVCLQMSAQFLHKRSVSRNFLPLILFMILVHLIEKKRYQGICYSGCEPFYIIIIFNNNSSHSYHWIQYCTYCTGQPNSSYTNLDIKEKLEFAYGS